jgi:hypothetical protein
VNECAHEENPEGIAKHDGSSSKGLWWVNSCTRVPVATRHARRCVISRETCLRREYGMSIFPSESKVSQGNGLVIFSTPYRVEMTLDDLSNLSCQLLLQEQFFVKCQSRSKREKSPKVPGCNSRQKPQTQTPELILTTQSLHAACGEIWGTVILSHN